jgi:acetyltransferase-like isoleucine patch superfamily enzyme
VKRVSKSAPSDEYVPSRVAGRMRLLGHVLLARLLNATGKSYAPADDLPLGLIFSVGKERLPWLIRGILRVRDPVFIGPRVRIRGKSRVNIGRYATLERHVTLDGYSRRGVTVGPRTKVGAYTVICCTGHLSLIGEGFAIGSDGALGEFTYVGASGGVVIGDSVIMGQFVTFHAQEHVYDDRSTRIREQGVSQRGIDIGDDCWVGARVTFLDGAHVGRGSVVAAGSVVRGKFPPYSVLAGIPARVVGQRGADVDDRSSS